MPKWGPGVLQNFLDGRNPIGVKSNTIHEVTHNEKTESKNGIIYSEHGGRLLTSKHSNYEKFPAYSSSAAVIFPKNVNNAAGVIQYCDDDNCTSTSTKVNNKINCNL